MRDSFKGFYNATETSLESAWKGDQTLFVFDTNVFLNLYGYAEQTREDFFELLRALGERVWIPYHVGLEYQRRRLEVIRDEKAIFNKIKDNLEKIENIFKGDFEQLALKRRFPKLHENTEKLHNEINKSISSYRRSVSYWDDKQPCVRSHDPIRGKLNDLINGKVGPAPENQEWLNNLYKEGSERYENKIPPGHKDKKKANSNEDKFSHDGLSYDRQFGDLILWKQLIEKAKDDNIKNVIFVTDDSKEDWWYILESRGKKQIGPHANLQSEIYRETSLEIFHMYNTSSFLESGKKILELGVHDSSIQDANTIFLQSFARPTTDIDSRISAEVARQMAKGALSLYGNFKTHKKPKPTQSATRWNDIDIEKFNSLIGTKNSIALLKWEDIEKLTEPVDFGEVQDKDDEDH